MMSDPASVAEALDLLRTLGASERLVRHGEIVAEVAAEISHEMVRLGVQHNTALVVVGAALHDAGKIVHPEELVGPGNRHEAAGERLLLDRDVSAGLARMCRTHGIWDGSDIALEDQLVRLADIIWKGARSERLEGDVTKHAASTLNLSHWEAFIQFDPVFENAASGAASRLSRALS